MGRTRVADLALALSLFSCQRDATPDGPGTAREASREFLRCAFDGVSGDATVAQFEAATRLALRRERGDFVVRAGRCEDALRVRGQVPACLAPLRARWSSLLPIAQRPGVDAIDLDVAVRRVGEGWGAARRCPE